MPRKTVDEEAKIEETIGVNVPPVVQKNYRTLPIAGRKRIQAALRESIEVLINQEKGKYLIEIGEQQRKNLENILT